MDIGVKLSMRIELPGACSIMLIHTSLLITSSTLFFRRRCKMKKGIISLILLATFALVASPVFAVGLIRLDPHGSYYGEAVMLDSPATFSVYIQSGDDALDPHIFLVMTESCFLGLTGPVTVDWPGGATPDLTIQTGDWTEETVNSVIVPPGCESGTGYTVASLKDHLETTGPIYWAFEPFLANPISTTPQQFTVTLDSSDPEMMVYALGKAEGDSLFSNRVPPTQPGFVVPELATILMATASFSALGLYALKRKR
jgi:hypothetical protein